MRRTTLFMHERFVVYYPSLARLLGSPLRAIILQALWFERDGNDETIMGYGVLSERTGIPERTLREHVTWLVKAGFLSRRRKSPMDATTVWLVEIEKVEEADAAESTDDPDPAGSADSIRQPADTADSNRQDLPTHDAAGSAGSSYKKEEELPGGDVTYSGTEQQQQDSADDAVPRHGTEEETLAETIPPFPWWARNHHLMTGADVVTQNHWLRAWRTICVQQDTSWTATDHLTLYLARCVELKKKPNPDEWIRWFAQDEQKAQQELRLRREQAGLKDRPGNPDFQ